MGDALTEGAWMRLLAFAAHARRMRDTAEEQCAAPANLLAEDARTLTREIGCELAALYVDLITASSREPLVLAQVGQSLDGRIATATGDSKYINGNESLDHLHRLRALAEAVVVGATTVAADNPRLTTRRVAGPSPTRVILDPSGRLDTQANVFDDSAPTLVITRGGLGLADRATEHPAAARGVAVLPLPAPDGRMIPPTAILACLRERGLATVLIEGGAHTTSAFLAAGCVDRMLVAVAPMLIGSGTAAIRLPPIGRLDEAIRFDMRPYRLGRDVLFDCVLPRGAAGSDRREPSLTR